MNQKIKLLLCKIIFTIAVFILAILISSRIMNREEARAAAKMPEASFPTITLMNQDVIYSRLYGYRNDMSIPTIHGQIYLTDETRSCEANVETYGARIEEISYELRTIDGDHLIEKTQIDNITETDEGNLHLSFTMKDLIDYDTEYMLSILIETHEGKVIRYYSRVMCLEDESLLNVGEHVAFARRFSEMTFQADPELKEYLESKNTSVEPSFEAISITSPFEYVTWDGLDIVGSTKQIIDVYDIHGQTASVSLSYQLSIQEDDGLKLYDVTENYFTRYAQERIYLIDFRRTMDCVMNSDKPDLNSGFLSFSYLNSPITFAESETGSTICFENANRLFVWQLAENRLTTVLSFRDETDPDRMKKNSCKINILRVDESGNVVFSVTGYFGRGEHEGEVGTAVYEFDSAFNYLTEYLFIRSNVSEQVLMQTAGELSYLGHNGEFYTVQGDGLYAIGIYNGEIRLLTDQVRAKNPSVSSSGEMIAWQNEAEDLSAGISVLNTSTGEVSVIKADNGEGVRMLSFLGNDLVYGFVKATDVQKSLMGTQLNPCYRIRITDMRGEVISQYDSAAEPVIDVVHEGNRIVLKRIKRSQSEEGNGPSAYTEATDDQITCSEEEAATVNSLLTRGSGKTRIQGIELAISPSVDKIRRLEAEITGEEAIKPQMDTALTDNCYISYDHGRAIAVYSVPGPAVAQAYVLCGQVVSEKGKYVYYRGNLTRKNQIMSLTKAVEGEDFSGMNSLTACLRVMMEYEGAAGDAGSLLSNGNSMGEILQKALPAATILDLNGCPLQAMTYYLDLMCDYPVLAEATGGKYVLLIGFNDTEVVVFDPTQPVENVYKMSIKEAAASFNDNGNHFMTYVK